MAFPAVAPNASKLPYALRPKGWRLVGSIAGHGLMLAMGLGLTAVLVKGARPASTGQALVALAFLGLGAYGVYRLWRLKDPEVELFPDRLVRPGLFSPTVLYRSDIEGVSRTYTTRSGSYFNVVAAPGRGRTLTFAGSLRNDPIFADWLSGAPDPTVVEKEADRASVLADDSYGATSAERANRLAWATRITVGFSVACAAVALWLGFFYTPPPIALGVVAACLAAAYALVAAFKGLVIWLPRVGVRPTVMAAPLPAAALAMRGVLTVHLLTVDPLLIAAMVAGVGVAVLLAQRTTTSAPRLQSALAVGAFAALLAYGGGAYLDAVSVGHPDQSYVVEVQDKHESHGRSTSYYLQLASWGDQPAKSVEVSSALYDSVEAGSSVCIDHYRGDLRLPWFDIGPCKGASATSQGPLPSPASAR